MSEITFDGQTHTLTLRDRSGHVVGTWAANNRTDNRATLPFVPNRDYAVQDSVAPNRHGAEDTANGEYGTQGIVRFNVPGHDGIGIHAGRQITPDRTPERGIGPDHVTMGCIRTTEDALTAIANTMRADPVTTVRVVNNRNQRR
ncbi:MAG TPA: L,D-transpeptidase family protein [Chthoniobacterales bacterium]